MKYMKKPVVIEATQWFKMGDHPAVTAYWTHDPECKGWGWVDTLEGRYIVTPGDFIITGVKGEHYPCKPDIFEMTYEAARETGPTLKDVLFVLEQDTMIDIRVRMAKVLLKEMLSHFPTDEDYMAALGPCGK